MPRGYYGDCRDCVYYDSYYHKINSDEYEYKCDMSREYFNGCYGSTCYLFEDKEDYRQERLAEQRKKEELVAAGVIINTLIKGIGDDASKPGCAVSDTGRGQSDFPLVEFLCLCVGWILLMKVTYIFFIGPIIDKLFS